MHGRGVLLVALAPLAVGTHTIPAGTTFQATPLGAAVWTHHRQADFAPCPCPSPPPPVMIPNPVLTPSPDDGSAAVRLVGAIIRKTRP